MLLIPYIESIVGGSMPTWPRVVLRSLFELPPTGKSALTLALFMYGNGLTCWMVLRLVAVCHCGSCDALLHKTQMWYDAWGLSPHVTHFGVYWNFRLQKHVWLNGSETPFEYYIGDEFSDNIQLGFGCLRPRDWVLRSKLYTLSRTAMY